MWRNKTGHRLYLDKTRTRVLREGHADCAFLLCGIDCEIPVKLAIDLGLFDPMDRESEITTIEDAEPISVETVNSKDDPVIEQKAYSAPIENKAVFNKEIKSGKKRR